MTKQIESVRTSSVGFWLYLMTDCLLFASLFATFAVLRGNTNGGPSIAEIVSLPYVMWQTVLLLASSLTSGLAYLSFQQQRSQTAVKWLLITMALGLGFLVLEGNEFAQLVSEGNSWQTSAFLSAFFTLIATHGLHITAGLIWAGVIVWLFMRRAARHRLTTQLTLFTMFWHFLELIWVCIFTFVYVMGAM